MLTVRVIFYIYSISYIFIAFYIRSNEKYLKLVVIINTIIIYMAANRIIIKGSTPTP